MSFLPLMRSRAATISLFARREAGAFRENATTFGVFDAFEDEPGRQAHLAGQIAAALGEAAKTKLSVPPMIAPVDLLGVKVS